MRSLVSQPEVILKQKVIKKDDKVTEYYNMKKNQFLFFSILIFTIVPSCKKKMNSTILSDSTPEGAILLLEQAYKEKDLQKCLSLRDFNAEAFLTFNKYSDKIGNVDMNDEIVKEGAKVLELTYIKEIKETGFPDFNDIISTFPYKKDLGDGFWLVTEVCKFPDGGYSRENIFVYYNGKSYKFVSPE